jgi:carboxypeptidase C (cathepsin A)
MMQCYDSGSGFSFLEIRMRKKIFVLLVSALFFLSAAPLAKGDGPPPEPKLSVTDGQVTIAGQALKYKATAGYMLLKDEGGKAKAEMFFVAYTKEPAEDPLRRPLTFVFNGGPGAAAVWLHLGTAGPQRVALNDEGEAPPPPYHLEDNPNSWLAATDLVFIDPIGTGYSRVLPGEKQEQFSGVEEDVHSVGEFIRLYLTRNQRWLSPKFLAGESYGTTRAARLSDHLLDDRGISLNGIVLISTVLDFRTIQIHGGNELPYPLYLPSYTAIAHHFKKLPADLQVETLDKTLKEVEQWALHDYLTALIAGSSLSKEQHKVVVAKLARFTGLSTDYIEKANLRINPSGFRAELLSKEQQLIGRFDARITGFNSNPANNSAEYDPSVPSYLAAYTATFNDYARRTLKFETDRSYDVLSGRVHPWNYGPAGNGYLNVTPNLQDAMIKSPKMKVMFCNGSADLATPYLAADYSIRQMRLNDTLRANITHRIYVGGHMIYHYHPSLEKLGVDVREFIHAAAAGGAIPVKAATRPAPLRKE